MNICTSSSVTKDDHERVRRRSKTTFNRFLSLNDNTLSSVENRRRLTKESTSNFIEEEKDKISDDFFHSFSHECDQCSKSFASEYGLNYHINMHHPNQSILCSDCNITFRSHRALKNHQQRFHSIYSKTKPNYDHMSSYLVVPFSTEQFSLIAKKACEQGHLPLGELTSKLFQCYLCHLSFPCSKALKYHLVNKHEQYEYELCKNILYDMTIQVEQNLRTVTNDDDDVADIEAAKFLLFKQASHLGLVDKQLARETRCLKHEQNSLIFASCDHQNRTCANLCLKYLSSYDKQIQNYPYKIPTGPKGTPFIQGSIVSRPTRHTLNSLNEALNSNQKRSPFKRVQSSTSDGLSSPKSKRKLLSTTEQILKTNFPMDTSNLTAQKKFSSKINPSYSRSLSSMSNHSSQSSSSKSSRHQIITSLKRSISPTITLAVERSSEKRRRIRERRKAKTLPSSSHTVLIKNDEEDDIVPIGSEQSKRRSKQRQASSGSVEYVQVLNNDQQSISSLNNIENLKLKSITQDDEISICQSPPPVKKFTSSSTKNLSKAAVNGTRKLDSHVTSEYDEFVRVRCKICGDILEGRSRFSKHVLTMHSHLLKKNMSDINNNNNRL